MPGKLGAIFISIFGTGWLISKQLERIEKYLTMLEGKLEEDFADRLGGR